MSQSLETSELSGSTLGLAARIAMVHVVILEALLTAWSRSTWRGLYFFVMVKSVM